MKTRLKILRELRGLTQEKLADKIHCSQQTISTIEKGHHGSLSLDVAIRLADYFNVNLDYLLFRTNYEKSLTPEALYPEEDEKAHRILHYYNQLSEDQKQTILKLMEDLSSKE